mgnify:FL=1
MTSAAFAVDNTAGKTLLYAVGNVTLEAFERLVIAMCEDDPEAAEHTLYIHKFQSEDEFQSEDQCRRWSDGKAPTPGLTWPERAARTRV